jgi:hypothetical protein
MKTPLRKKDVSDGLCGLEGLSLQEDRNSLPWPYLFLGVVLNVVNTIMPNSHGPPQPIFSA